MLTKEGCRNRRKRLWDSFEAGNRPDWIVIADPQHLMYFGNYFQSPFVFRSADAGAMLILGPDDNAILVADNLLDVFAEKAHVSEVVAPTWYDGKTSAPHRESRLVLQTLERLKKCPGHRIGVELSMTPAGLIEGLRGERAKLEVVDVDPRIRRLKRSKDADELELLRRSMRAAEAGQYAGLNHIHPGMTELQAFLLVQKAAIEAAGEQAVVYGDFVSGPRTEKIGGPPSDRVIRKGDLFILDFSVSFYHYRGDFANTFVVDGKPTDDVRKLFDACKQAMAVGERSLKANVACKMVDKAVRDFFDARHLGQNFPHHTGHGIGLGHPEPPYLVSQSVETLVPGDVVTIEPGQYIAGIGGMRIERNYLITATGYELLSKHAIALTPEEA